MAEFKDHFSGHAGDYRTYRPSYPPELFTYLATLVPQNGLVWDCGSGNGQASVALAEHFERVFATDASERQIREAEPHPRVEYAVAMAERCPLPDRSAQLVTVAQALHWFDFDGFFKEVKRVCQPGGHLAVWTYDFDSVDPDVDPVLNKFQKDFVEAYWPPERVHVISGYQTIPFPFEELSPPALEMRARWNLAQLLGYLNTWSATKAFIKRNGFNPTETLELQSAWGDPSRLRTVHWAFYIRVGRVGE
jgi:SAM-dependent methyltransferase